jgi:hypothetical protein
MTFDDDRRRVMQEWADYVDTLYTWQEVTRS